MRLDIIHLKAKGDGCFGCLNEREVKMQAMNVANSGRMDTIPIELSNADLVEQRLEYVHDNPVRAGFVLSAEEYKYSSARNYAVV